MKIEFTSYEQLAAAMDGFCRGTSEYIPTGKKLKLPELSNNGDYRCDVFGFRLVLPGKCISVRPGYMYSFRNGKWNEESPTPIIATYELDEKDPVNAIEGYSNVDLAALLEAFPDVEPEDGCAGILAYIDTDELQYE